MDFKGFYEFVFAENSHPNDGFEDLIAETIFKLVAKSVKDFFDSGKQTKLSQLLVNNAKGNASIRNFGSVAAPKNGVQINVPTSIRGTQLPPELANVQVRITPTKQDVGASAGGSLMELSINSTTLANAASYDDPEIQRMLSRLQYQIHHEMTHFSSGQVDNANKQHSNPYLNGTQRDTPEYNQGKINYYTDAGELRAHAKQYAVLYARYYPGQAFDLNKMLALSSLDSKIERFFKGFAEKGQSQIWNMDVSAYQNQLNAAGQKFIALVNHFLSVINNRSTNVAVV